MVIGYRSTLGTQSNRRGIGTTVTLTQDDLTLIQELPGGTSYCSSHEPLLSFGLGESASPFCNLDIHWPSGRRQTLRGVAADQSLVVFEGDAE